MVRLRKAYFTLEELVEHWNFPEHDLRYVAENGLLQLSIRLVGFYVQLGERERDLDGSVFHVPYEERWYEGLVDLFSADVFRLLRDGTVAPRYFMLPENHYVELLRDDQHLNLRRGDLLVRAEERRRFEGEVLPSLLGSPNDYGDFTKFDFEGKTYAFTMTQARALQFLYEAARRDEPWQSGKVLLASSGSCLMKVGELFKRRPEWRDLIESDSRGLYRLSPTMLGKT